MDQRVIESAPLLTATVLHGRLEGLVGEIHLAQTFRNAEAVNIEAVFTFPVPPEAVLLGVEVTLDGRVLRGQVLPATQAEEDYEEAIVSGDGALLLQSAGRGLYTINVGNLLPGQVAELDYRYALLGVWDDDLWRLVLPTTLAPRYGDPHQAGLAPHQVPQVALFTEHRFTLDLVLGGSLAQASVASPSHPLTVIPEEGGQRVRLAQGSAPLDRDLVLLIRAAADARAGQALVARDLTPDTGDSPPETVVLLSVQPQLPVAADPGGHDYVLVADASGSMAGDSITQTREALLAILDRLQPADRFNLIVFGSAPAALFPSLAVADATHLARAHHAVRHLQADRGGTEIGAAMRLAHGQRQDRTLDILLITDGEAWDTQEMIRFARQAGDRIFTLGVGAAVATDLVQGLAQATGGACTLVHPNEAMGDKIVRQFARLRAPRARVTLTWPGAPCWQWPAAGEPVFAGDTHHWLAGFTTPPTGPVTLTCTLTDGTVQTQTLDLQPWPETAGGDTLPRLAADRRLGDLDRTTATALAVRYQLVSPHTHFVLRDPREAAAQADSLPQVRQVPHQLAAGWGGMGTVASARGIFATCLPPSPMLQDCDMSFLPSAGPAQTSSRGGLSKRAARAASSRIMSGIPDTLVLYQPTTPRPFSAYLEDQAQRLANPKQPLPTLAQIIAAGLPEELAEKITALLAQGAAEGPVIAAVLYGLLLQPAPGRTALRETLRRLRYTATRGLPKDQAKRLVALAKSFLPLTS
jgi:Ca-activated chloride channel family protein